MKLLIRTIAIGGLAVMIGMGAMGCDLGGNGDQQPVPPPKPTQPGQLPQPPSYPPQDEPYSTRSQLPISDAELERAAAAYVEITENERKLQESMQQAGDESVKQDMQTAANQRMILAIRNAGLTVDMYNNIMRIVRMNQELSDRFQEKVESFK